MYKFLTKKQKEELKDDGWTLFNNKSGGVWFTIDAENVSKGSSLKKMSKLEPNKTYRFLVFAYKKEQVVN